MEAEKISIVVPIFNEELVLMAFYESLSSVLAKVPYACRIIFVNDGSVDKSLSILRHLRETDKRIKVIDFSRNFGHQAAITAGIDHAEGEACVIMDGDLQHPPELILKMLSLWQEGNKLVIPVKKSRGGESFLKRFFSRAFYKVFRYVANVNIIANASDFQLLDRQVLDVFKKLPERQRFIRGLSIWTGFKKITFDYDQDERAAGKTKYSWLRMIRLSLDGITSFSHVPLQLAGAMGLVISFFAGIYAIYAVWIRLVVRRAVPGWTSILVMTLFLGGVQLMSLGIIGEYIGRLFDEVKSRPAYIVQEIYE